MRERQRERDCDSPDLSLQGQFKPRGGSQARRSEPVVSQPAINWYSLFPVQKQCWSKASSACHKLLLRTKLLTTTLVLQNLNHHSSLSLLPPLFPPQKMHTVCVRGSLYLSYNSIRTSCLRVFSFSLKAAVLCCRIIFKESSSGK